MTQQDLGKIVGTLPWSSVALTTVPREVVKSGQTHRILFSLCLGNQIPLTSDLVGFAWRDRAGGARDRERAPKSCVLARKV